MSLGSPPPPRIFRTAFVALDTAVSTATISVDHGSQRVVRSALRAKTHNPISFDWQESYRSRDAGRRARGTFLQRPAAWRVEHHGAIFRGLRMRDDLRRRKMEFHHIWWKPPPV